MASDAQPHAQPDAQPGAQRDVVSRRVAWFLLGVAVWMVFIWGTFIRNLAKDHGRPTAFYVVHAVLIVIDLAIAAVLALIAVRALRASRSDQASRPG